VEAGNGGALQQPSDRASDDVADLRSARRRLVLGADADRRWIERELHDGVHQRLVALAVKLQLARRRVETHPDEVTQLLEELGGDVQAALDELVGLVQRIHPPFVGPGGLGAALRAVASRAGTPVSIDVRAGAGYPPEVVSTVYRCCLVALGNEAASVTVRDTGGALVFDLEAKAGWSDGLDGMRDRVEALDGSLTIESRLDGPTRVVGSLPLP